MSRQFDHIAVDAGSACTPVMMAEKIADPIKVVAPLPASDVGSCRKGSFR